MKNKTNEYIDYLKYQRKLLNDNNVKYFDPYNEKLIETIDDILSL